MLGSRLASAHACGRARAFAPSIGALPPRSRAVSERTIDAPFERIGADNLARAALNRQLEQPAARTSGAHNGNIASQRAVMEVMPTVPRQALANDIARHAWPAITGSRLIIGVARRPAVRGCHFIIAINSLARHWGRVGDWRRVGEGPLGSTINVRITRILVDRAVTIGWGAFVEVGGLRARAASSRGGEQAHHQNPTPHGHSPVGRLSVGKVAAAT